MVKWKAGQTQGHRLRTRCVLGGSRFIHVDERAFSRRPGTYFFSSSNVPCFWIKCFAFSAMTDKIQGNFTSTRT